jgi:hypothetical protein
MLIQKNPDGSTEGLNPLSVSKDALLAAGHEKRKMNEVIRSKCLDCCAGSKSEVIKCTAIGCALWPYRAGRDPFALPRGRGSQVGLKRAADPAVERSSRLEKQGQSRPAIREGSERQDNGCDI